MLSLFHQEMNRFDHFFWSELTRLPGFFTRMGIASARPSISISHSATSPCCSCVLTQSEIRAAPMELKVTGLAGDVICVVNISDRSLTSRNRKPVRSASCQRGTSWAQFSSPTLKTAGEVDDLLTSIDILNHFHTFFQMILNIFTCWHFQVFIGIFTCFLHVFNP